MWRQVFVICLLFTLSEIWSGVHATPETLPGQEQNMIDALSRKQFEKSRKHEEVEAPDGLAKDAKEPNEPAASDVGSPQSVAESSGTDTNSSKSTEHAPHAPPQSQVGGPHKTHSKLESAGSSSDIIFLVTVAACSVAGLVGIIMAGVCWYKLNRSAKAASDVEYPAYGVTGPNKERIPSPGDRKLAQSAQMYHYQHQKQQMIAMEKANGEMKHDASDEESEEENEEGDYTVYECPGLAPTGEMEVKNPLFSDETPVTPSAGDEDKKDGIN